MSPDEMDSWGAPIWERDGVEHVAFETLPEAEQWVGVALGSEAGADDYDVAAIARECFVFDPATDPAGVTRLDRQRFRLAVTGPQFWESVARHDAGVLS